MLISNANLPLSFKELFTETFLAWTHINKHKDISTIASFEEKKTNRFAVERHSRFWTFWSSKNKQHHVHDRYCHNLGNSEEDVGPCFKPQVEVSPTIKYFFGDILAKLWEQKKLLSKVFLKYLMFGLDLIPPLMYEINTHNLTVVRN